MSAEYEFEWGEAKRVANLRKHGVDFADAERLDWDRALTVDRMRGGELRHLTYAPLENRLHALV